MDPKQRNFVFPGTIFCWGINDVPAKGLSNTPCTFLVTDETIPRPPRNCEAKKNTEDDIIVTCEKGHDGGLPQVRVDFEFYLLAVNATYCNYVEV